MRARCGSATRARSSSATACSTRSMPWSRRMESASLKSSPRAWTGRTASPSTTARSTSPKARKFRSSKRSRTISTIRRSPSSSTISSPTTSRTVGKFIAVGPDNKLYINVGAPCNICLPPETNAQITRMNLDGSGAETYVRGVRNSVGFDFHPVTKELYFTDNGRDWLSEDLPNDELNRVTKAGQHFGYPYCHQGNVPDDQFGWGRSCSDYEAPVALLGPHTAALGMRFYTGTRQELYRPPGGRRGAQGRFAAGVGRLRRRDLPHQLRRPPRRRALNAFRPPFGRRAFTRNLDCARRGKCWTLQRRKRLRHMAFDGRRPGEGSVFRIGRIIMTYLSRRRGFVLAGALGTLLFAVSAASAQQQAPLPPGSPLIGRPDTEAAKKLAPVAPPPLPAAADKLPLDKLKAPKGFTIEVYASGLDNARTLRLGDKGTVFVSSRLKDKVYAIVDKGGKREVKVVASGLYRPNGIVLHKGTLYIAELSQISKIENVEDQLDN